MFKWVYDLVTNEFLHGGPCEPVFNADTQGLVELSRNPEPRRHRYDGVNGIRPATDQEITDYDAAQLVRQSLGRFDDEKLVKALAIWTAGKLNVPPATAKQEILAILRGL
jgi:hypothetical protein